MLDQLPPRTDTRVPVEMTGEQMDEHDGLLKPIAALLRIRERRPLTQAEFLKLMTLLMTQRIISNGIAQLRFEEVWPALRSCTPEESMIRAGERRLRPILMTALATVAGMIPLALALGAGSQMLQPLAIAVIGGIAASMVLSLVVTPAVHYYIGGRNHQA